MGRKYFFDYHRSVWFQSRFAQNENWHFECVFSGRSIVEPSLPRLTGVCCTPLIQKSSITDKGVDFSNNLLHYRVEFSVGMRKRGSSVVWRCGWDADVNVARPEFGTARGTFHSSGWQKRTSFGNSATLWTSAILFWIAMGRRKTLCNTNLWLCFLTK